ncbi:MAG: hypothetical protein NVSMB47_00560 [Polyangiales bacterium]
MKAALPAGGAVVLIGALILFARGGGAPATPVPSETTVASASPPPQLPSATIATVASPSAVAAPPTAIGPLATASVSAAPSSSVGLPVDPAEYPSVSPTVVGSAPSVVPGKKWTDQEKLQKLKATMASVDLREKSLQDEIAAAQKAGNTQEVTDKKVLLERVRQRKVELQKALAAGDTSTL